MTGNRSISIMKRTIRISHRSMVVGLASLAIMATLVIAAGCAAPEPKLTPTSTPASTPAPTSTPALTPAPTSTLTPTPVATSTPAPTPTQTPTLAAAGMKFGERYHEVHTNKLQLKCEYCHVKATETYYDPLAQVYNLADRRACLSCHKEGAAQPFYGEDWDKAKVRR